MKTQYANIANKYHEHMLSNSISSKNDFISICGLTDKEITILEYGCGSGIDAKYYIDKYNNIVSYVGVDNSDEMLEKFKKTLKQDKIKGLLADIDTYNPEIGHYDLVFGLRSIHYTNDLETLMKKVYSALKVGGYFCLRDAHPIVGFLLKKSKKYDTKEIVDFPFAGGCKEITVKHPTFTFEEYVSASSNAGFRIVSLNENMSKQGKELAKELGLDGYIIPTSFTLILKKD
jgi:SAM-dependent methyltransferase